jgi:predicted DCC family thiol-disulfide oxidoreductase YuxK
VSEYTVIYDGDCRMCSRIVRMLHSWGGGVLETVAFQQADVGSRFPWISSADFQASLQLVGPGRKTWQGGAAIEQLLTILPRGRAISWIFRIPLIRYFADRIYRWIARNRYRLGCGDHCRIV